MTLTISPTTVNIAQTFITTSTGGVPNTRYSVTWTRNGVSYLSGSSTLDGNGNASLPGSFNESGSYVLTVTYAASGNVRTARLTVENNRQFLSTPYQIITPMSYTSSVGDKGIFSKRTGVSKPLIEVNIDNITIFPFFQGIGQFVDRVVIKARLISLKGSKFSIPEKYYQYSNKLTISGFASNVDFILQIRLIETKTISDKNLALSGGKPKIARNGSINQFRFKYISLVDTQGFIPEITASATEDFTNLPSVYGKVIRPPGGVF
jgi:hypothetical protein